VRRWYWSLDWIKRTFWCWHCGNMKIPTWHDHGDGWSGYLIYCARCRSYFKEHGSMPARKV
jgi:hypothetical protein